MPNKCWVPKCKTNNALTKIEQEEKARTGELNEKEKYSVFRFPNDPDLKDSWLRNIKRDKAKPTQNAVICARHFTDDCFHDADTNARGGERCKISLKKYAVPTVFSDYPSYKSSSKPQEKPTTKAETSARLEASSLCITKLKEEVEEEEGNIDTEMKVTFNSICKQLPSKDLILHRGINKVHSTQMLKLCDNNFHDHTSKGEIARVMRSVHASASGNFGLMTSDVSEECQQGFLEEEKSGAKGSWTGTGCRRGVRVDANGFPVKKNGKMYKSRGYIYEKARAYYERRMATETPEEKALRLEKARLRYYRKKEEQGSPLPTLLEGAGERRARQQRVRAVRTNGRRSPRGRHQPPAAQLLQALINTATQGEERIPPPSQDCGGDLGGTQPPATQFLQAIISRAAQGEECAPPPFHDSYGGEGSPHPPPDLLARLQRLRAALMLQTSSPTPLTGRPTVTAPDGDTCLGNCISSEAE